jgi:hypothetical protein
MGYTEYASSKAIIGYQRLRQMISLKPIPTVLRSHFLSIFSYVIAVTPFEWTFHSGRFPSAKITGRRSLFPTITHNSISQISLIPYILHSKQLVTVEFTFCHGSGGGYRYVILNLPQMDWYFSSLSMALLMSFTIRSTSDWHIKVESRHHVSTCLPFLAARHVQVRRCDYSMNRLRRLKASNIPDDCRFEHLSVRQRDPATNGYFAAPPKRTSNMAEFASDAPSKKIQVHSVQHRRRQLNTFTP